MLANPVSGFVVPNWPAHTYEKLLSSFQCLLPTNSAKLQRPHFFTANTQGNTGFLDFALGLFRTLQYLGFCKRMAFIVFSVRSHSPSPRHQHRWHCKYLVKLKSPRLHRSRLYITLVGRTRVDLFVV